MPPHAEGQMLTKGRLWLSVAVSFVLAAVVYVIFVLPAEFARDPTGLGKLMGLNGMSGFEASSLALEEIPAVSDEAEFPLAPFESVEYKYELDAGQAMVYSWVAGGEVVFDFHSEEKGTDPEDSISFSTGRGAEEHGTYIAPYPGKHGWYWENRGAREVVVRIKTHSYSPASITYSPQGEYRRELKP